MDNKNEYIEGSKALETDYLVDRANNLNNLPEGRKIMTKVKPNRCFLNFQQRVRASVRYVATFVLILVIGYFSVNYLQVNHPTMTIIPTKDRSETYRVKVIPNSLDDKQLHELPKETFSYLAMIDAGSSGCRAHVYRYGKLGSVDGPLYILPQHQSKKVKPGLSSFADKPLDAGASLADLIAFVKEQVPEKDWEVTPIWLKATAGLRMLPNEKSEAILESVRQFLLNNKNSPFLFRASYARIIPGNEEGGFGWIAFNYLKKIIGPKKDKALSIPPYTVIEMGGASAQVSQSAPNAKEASLIPAEYRFSFNIEDDEYHLYTHSYLGYGAEQAREQFTRLLAKAASTGTINTTTTTVATTSSKENSADPCRHTGMVSASKSRRSLREKRRFYNHNNHEHRILQAEELAANNTSTTATTSTNELISTVTGQCSKSIAALFSPVSSAMNTLLNTNNSSSSSSSRATKNRCASYGPFSFNCVYQPAFVTESTNILAFENFYYLSSALGVLPASTLQTKNNNLKNDENNQTVKTEDKDGFPLETTPNHVKDAADRFCALEWSAASTQYPKDNQGKEVNGKMCFIASFAYAFLVDGLKIPVDKVITIQKEVGDSEIEWALGAAYKEAAAFLKRSNLRPT